MFVFKQNYSYYVLLIFKIEFENKILNVFIEHMISELNKDKYNQIK